MDLSPEALAKLYFECGEQTKFPEQMPQRVYWTWEQVTPGGRDFQIQVMKEFLRRINGNKTTAD